MLELSLIVLATHVNRFSKGMINSFVFCFCLLINHRQEYAGKRW